MNIILFVVCTASLYEVSQEALSHHKHLNLADLKRIFDVNNYDDVPSYESTKITEHMLRKDDDNSSANAYVRIIKIQATMGNFTILLKPNRYLVHPHLKDRREFQEAARCLFQGIVISPQVDGRVAFSNCHGNGYEGRITLSHDSIEIKPIPRYVRAKLKLTGPEYHFLVSRSSNGQQLRPKRQASATKLFMELNIVFDNAFKRNIQDPTERITGVLKVVNQAQMVYLDSSLNREIFFVVKRLQQLSGGTVTPGATNSIAEYLDSFCKSQRSLGNTVDNSILLTGLDLQSQGSNAVAGIAYLSSTCLRNTRCTVVEQNVGDSDETTGKILAHEIGHNLGMDHDCQRSRGNTCSRTCDRLGVMSPGFDPENANNGIWSDCSRSDLLSHLSKNRRSCLIALPDTEVIDRNLKEPVEGRMAMDTLCEFQFQSSEARIESVSPYNNPCESLYCLQANGQTIMAAISGFDGMRCDDGTGDNEMFCRNEVCEASGSGGSSTQSPTVTTQQSTTVSTTQGRGGGWGGGGGGWYRRFRRNKNRRQRRFWSNGGRRAFDRQRNGSGGRRGGPGSDDEDSEENNFRRRGRGGRFRRQRRFNRRFHRGLGRRLFAIKCDNPPTWETGSWNNCDGSCGRRNVWCTHVCGTCAGIIPDNKCDVLSKPETKKECYCNDDTDRYDFDD